MATAFTADHRTGRPRRRSTAGSQLRSLRPSGHLGRGHRRLVRGARPGPRAENGGRRRDRQFAVQPAERSSGPSAADGARPLAAGRNTRRADSGPAAPARHRRLSGADGRGARTRAAHRFGTRRTRHRCRRDRRAARARRRRSGVLLMSEEPVLLCTDRDGVRTLTLNRPRRKNAINRELWIALAQALTAAGKDSGVRAVVITGAEGAFCSGADISTPDDSHPVHKLQRLTDVALALHELSVPTIAKVNGVAVGAGWNLALGCDLVAATPESTFSQIFSKRGLSVDLGGSWLLPKIVGLQRAKRLVLLAETIDAAEAHALGLVTWMVDAGGIDAFVADVADRLAAGPPVALAHSKALLNEGVDRTMRDALANEARAQVGNFATVDSGEAYAAFAEKRDPSFTGQWAVKRSEQKNA